MCKRPAVTDSRPPHPAASVEQVAAWTCLPALTRSAITVSPTCWWISSYQCSLVQIKPSKASWGSLGMWAKLVRLLFSRSKLRSMNNSFCRSLHGQSAAGGGWQLVEVSNLFGTAGFGRGCLCAAYSHTYSHFTRWWMPDGSKRLHQLTKRNKLCISITRIRFIRLCYFPSQCE